MNKTQTRRMYMVAAPLGLLLMTSVIVMISDSGQDNKHGTAPEVVMESAVVLTHSEAEEAEGIVATVAINSANAELFQQLSGIGKQLSERIVAHREQHGVFQSIEELAQVKGVSLRMVERNRDRLSL